MLFCISPTFYKNINFTYKQKQNKKTKPSKPNWKSMHQISTSYVRQRVPEKSLDQKVALQLMVLQLILKTWNVRS